ncbi:MAG: tetratricopeptide repeat-containing serine protease family protein [Bryobacteraceae bacterium]|nr:tetratricopeptide repeat-containing serine protease family protein [Bryobacteraceae bacterium]
MRSACLALGLVAAAHPPSQPHSFVERAVVTVLARDAEGAVRAQCTGILLSPRGQVLTSMHPFHAAPPTEIRTADGTVYRVKDVAAQSATAELVRLEVDVPEGVWLPSVQLGEAPPEAGATVTVVTPQHRAKGTVEAARSVSGFATLLRVKAPAPEDPTGAPLVDASGAVVGMILWPSRRQQGFYVAASAELAGQLHPRPPEAQTPAACSGESEGLYRNGVERLIAQEFEEARQDFERATAADPRCAPGWLHLGFALGKLGRTAERLKAYQKAIEVRPDFADAHYSLGVAYALANRRTEALEHQQVLEKLDRELAHKLRLLIEAITHGETMWPAALGDPATRI